MNRMRTEPILYHFIATIQQLLRQICVVSSPKNKYFQIPVALVMNQC